MVGDEVEVELALQTLGDDLHVEQTKEAAAEAEAQRGTGFQLKGQGGVVELQLFQRVLQIGVPCAVGGVDAAEDHGLDLTVAGQSLGGGVIRQGDGVADAGVLHGLDAGGQVADLTGLQLVAGGQLVAPMWPTSTSVNCAPVAIRRMVSPGLTVPSKTRI